MKTIIVIYTDKPKTPAGLERAGETRYCFNVTNKDAKELSTGDMLDSEEYNTKIQVVEVLDEHFTYYETTGGEMSHVRTNTNQARIKQLKLSEKGVAAPMRVKAWKV